MNAIPLINNIPKSNINGNEKQLRQEINTSLVALKKEAGTLEGLINEAAQMLVTINNRIATLENDTVKKSDIVDVVQSGNMNPVTSNAVADKISSLDVASVGGSGKYISEISEIDGKINATATDLGNMVPVDTVTSGNMHSVTSNAIYNFLVNYLKRVKTVSVASSSISITDLPRGVYLVFTTDLYHNYYLYNLGVLCRYDNSRTKYTTISQDDFPIETSTDGTKLETTSNRYFLTCNFYQVGY
jgi:hypothetical protein